MRRKLPQPEEILAAVHARAGDGFCRVADLEPAFRGTGRRDLRRALRIALNRGLLIERRHPSSGHVVTIAAEGWRVLRGG